MPSHAGPRTEPYAFYMHGVPATPEVAGAISARQRELAGTLAPHISGRKPFNFLASDEISAIAFSPDAHARLRNLKQSRDPQGVIRSNSPYSPDPGRLRRQGRRPESTASATAW